MRLHRCRFADFIRFRDQSSLAIAVDPRATLRALTMALSRITDDVLFVIIDALKIEDIILLGAASRRLRTITTTRSVSGRRDS